MKLGRLLLIVVCPAWLWAGPSTLKNVFYDEDHDVFYQEQFHQLMARAQTAIPRAYESIMAQWGLKASGELEHPLIVQVKELSSDTLVRTKVAYVQPRGQGSGLTQYLVIDIGYYIQHPHEQVEDVVTHEMAHVILEDLESAPGAARIPSWFNEGLAQSVTSEGRKRVLSDIVALHRSGAPLLLCDLEGPVDEFSHGPFNLNAGCYPEYFLAVQRFRQLGGPEAILKAMKGLREGTGMPELVSEVTGMDWPDFKKEVNRYASDVFEGKAPIPGARGKEPPPNAEDDDR